MKRLAVIGIGSWGSRVAREAALLLKEGAVGSVYICDTDQNRIDAFRLGNKELLAGLKGISYHTDLDSMLNDRIDFAHICTFNRAHFEVARKMLQHKINFIVEKPVSDKVSEVDELERLCKANPSVISKNGLIFRFDNSIKEIKRLYSSGGLGKPYFMRFYWEFSREYMDGVDIIWDLMPHLIDAFGYVTGEKSHFVSGVKTQFRRKKLSELAEIVLETESGIKGLFNISWFSSRKNRIIEIFGNKKILNADLLSQSITLYNPSDMSKSETVSVVRNNTIRDELINLISDSESGKNTVNSIEIGFEVARYLDLIDRKTSSV